MTEIAFRGEEIGAAELVALTIGTKSDVIRFDAMLGKPLLPEIKKPVAPGNRPAQQSSKLDEAAFKSVEEVLEMLGTSAAGLSDNEAAARLEHYGPNKVAYQEKRRMDSSPLHLGA